MDPERTGHLPPAVFLAVCRDIRTGKPIWRSEQQRYIAAEDDAKRLLVCAGFSGKATQLVD